MLYYIMLYSIPFGGGLLGFRGHPIQPSLFAAPSSDFSMYVLKQIGQIGYLGLGLSRVVPVRLGKESFQAFCQSHLDVGALFWAICWPRT